MLFRSYPKCESGCAEREPGTEATVVVAGQALIIEGMVDSIIAAVGGGGESTVRSAR